MTQTNVVNAAKTATFQMRINPEIKKQVEEIFAQSGLTLTDAINVFLQQSINVKGLPFAVTSETNEALKAQAIEQLRSEIQKGLDSVKTESDWVSHEEMLAHFGIEK